MGEPVRWGGFVDDKLDVRKVDTGFGGYGVELTDAPAVFATKKRARQEYRDVRPVLITQVEK